MVILTAKNITLKQVHSLLHFEEEFDGSFTSVLSLEALTDAERQDLIQIRHDFRAYLVHGKVLEGQIKLLAIAPLLRLAGFYRSPIKMTLVVSGGPKVIISDNLTPQPPSLLAGEALGEGFELLN